MKIPAFCTEELVNGFFAISKYNVIKQEYVQMEGEIYSSEGDAKVRVEELNDDVPPIEI